jgi:isocitrate lyase
MTKQNGSFSDSVEDLRDEWKTNPRWKGVRRDYAAEDVVRLRGSFPIEHTLARHGASRLWDLIQNEDYVPALGALSGGQAVQMVKAGLKAIYASGWQVAADINNAEAMYPDQSLYPSDSMPTLIRRINNALMRQDQLHWAEGTNGTDWMVPIVADGEAGFGGPLNAFELTKALIHAGAAGVHFEDQLASAKKCGHMGGKVLIPSSHHIRNLSAARLAGDVMGVPTVVIARTDALSANLLSNNVDERDREFITGERTVEGYFEFDGGLPAAIKRGLAFAPYSDMLWFETSKPDLDEAKEFADAIHAKFPDQLLAYNCSPSFNWRKHLDDETIAEFQQTIGALGFKFQFITLAGFHSINHGMFELARGYVSSGMTAYVELQTREFGSEEHGYTATKHQREVGTGYFDDVASVIQGEKASTLAMHGSTEEDQFTAPDGTRPKGREPARGKESKEEPEAA